MGRRLNKLAQFVNGRPVVAYVGWVGHRNVGDEVLFKAITGLLSGLSVVPYQRVTPALRAVEVLLRGGQLFDATLLGGGTLLNEPVHHNLVCEASHRYGPLYVFGTGLRDPDYWRHDADEPFDGLEATIAMLRGAKLIAVRGERSAAPLREAGLVVDVIGDPSLSACRSRPTSPQVARIGVNLGHHQTLFGDQSTVIASVATAIKQWAARGHAIELFAMHPLDEPPLLALRSEAAVDMAVPTRVYELSDPLSVFDRFDLVVGQRLHAVVLAIGCGVPSIALEYRPKCAEFMESVGQGDVCIRTDRVTSTALCNAFDQIDSGYAARCAGVIEAADHWRGVQARSAEQLVRRIAENHVA